MPGKRIRRVVLITASGVGTPLGDVTKYTNKVLIKVGRKPALSYIVEAYPEDTEFVITLGYYGDQVQDFMRLVYPDRQVVFIPVDKYHGEGSSLAYSMLQAEPYLQRPFIYHASDTIVQGEIPYPDCNWIGGYRGNGSSHYASFNMLDGRISRLHDKGAINPDYLHIGLVGIKDYRKFWDIMRRLHKEDPLNSSLGDIHTINAMLEEDHEFGLQEYPVWHDIGNVESLEKARQEIEDAFHILDKLEESIFIFDDSVVKFFHNEKTITERIARAEVIRDLVPEILGHSKNFYRYRFVEGDLFADVANRANIYHFLEWAKEKLWKPVKEVGKKEFREICYDFYYNKTVERVNKFLNTRSVKDEENIINGETVPKVFDLLKQVDFEWLCSAEQSHFHGDFILDNIIKTVDGYCLLDWRQNFGGLIKAGDKYYDLAKLNHNLTVNHAIISDNLFTVKVHKQEVGCDIMRRESLVNCQQALMEFLEKEGYDKKKVKVLTSIIWLNMAPLHHHPFDLFLYYFGKLNLLRALKEA